MIGDGGRGVVVVEGFGDGVGLIFGFGVVFVPFLPFPLADFPTEDLMVVEGSVDVEVVVVVIVVVSGADVVDDDEVLEGVFVVVDLSLDLLLGAGVHAC